jgi:hypothetical protein
VVGVIAQPHADARERQFDHCATCFRGEVIVSNQASTRPRAIRTAAKVTGTRVADGGRTMASSGSRAPEVKDSADAAAAWTGLGKSSGSVRSSGYLCPLAVARAALTCEPDGMSPSSALTGAPSPVRVT